MRFLSTFLLNGFFFVFYKATPFRGIRNIPFVAGKLKKNHETNIRNTQTQIKNLWITHTHTSVVPWYPMRAARKKNYSKSNLDYLQLPPDNISFTLPYLKHWAKLFYFSSSLLLGIYISKTMASFLQYAHADESLDRYLIITYTLSRQAYVLP